jgi:hypothetical protein
MSRTIILVALWSLVGCVVSDEPSSIVVQTVLTANGVNPNGVNPNGVNPNGVNPNGVNPNGVNPNGVNPNGVNPNVVTLNGVNPNGVNPNGSLIGVSGSGAPLTGSEYVGTTWTGNLSNGATVVLRIDEALQLTGVNTDVWAYQISVSADGAFRPLCVSSAGVPGLAVTVPGTWNLAQGVPGGGAYNPTFSQFTVACRGSAIAKCVELGYKPWTGRTREVASCVRALRADYCGDGTPYTVDGTLVNIFDADGLQTDDVDWEPEAEWTPDGARCVSKKKETRFHQALRAMPSCFPHAVKPEKSCGTEFGDGAVLITELTPQ